jgi:hypothetical protein
MAHPDFFNHLLGTLLRSSPLRFKRPIVFFHDLGSEGVADVCIVTPDGDVKLMCPLVANRIAQP